MHSLILYVEDDKAQIELISYYLSRQKHTAKIDFVHTGVEAINKFDSDKYALVVIDYNLPDTDAPQVAKQILAKQPSFPIVFVSSLFTDDRITKAESLGVKLCIEKGDIRENLHQIFNLLGLD